MGRFKDYVTDVCNDWYGGKTLSEIARCYSISLGQTLEILINNCPDIDVSELLEIFKDKEN